MRHMEAVEFEAKCREVLDEIAEGGEGVVVTKEGIPLVHVLPDSATPTPYFGWGARAHVAIHVPDDVDLTAPAFDPDDWDGDESDGLWEERAARPDATERE